MTVPAIIGIDWGSTSFRAYLMDARGAILEQRNAPQGVLSIRKETTSGEPDFEAVLENQVGPWLASAPAMPIIASGMIGSRQGWVEVPYVQAPASAADLAGKTHVHRTQRGRLLRIVPGIECRSEGGIPDVLRGEETQAVSVTGAGSRLCLLPGTHCKWIAIESGKITGFSTFMTGELFAVLRDHSILGRLMDGSTHDRAAFDRGVDFGLLDQVGAGGLLKRLFSARTLALVGELPNKGVASYLSGLLIGAEVREAKMMIPAEQYGQGVLLLGDAALVSLYARALEKAGMIAKVAAPDSAARGLARIAALAGLLS